MDPAQQPSRGKEVVQVHALGVQFLAVPQAVAAVVELRLGQHGGRTQDHLVQRGRQIGIHSHVDPQAEQDGHLDEALR